MPAQIGQHERPLTIPPPAARWERIIAIRDQVASGPIEMADTCLIHVKYSPRLSGEDPEYVQALAESGTALPAIVVHRPTMGLIDGRHRLRAAVARGDSQIAVRYFDGTEDEAQLLAVALNVVHGRPLSPADRAEAARRILSRHADWSDRAVAAVAGVSPRKVAEIRRRAMTPEAAESCAGRRTGRDGRVRPLNSVEGRKRASMIIKARPEVTLREVASGAGISVATAADVRARMRRGEDVVPLRLRGDAVAAQLVPAAMPVAGSGRGVGTSGRDLTALFDYLQRDPSLRFSETGRMMLRMFGLCGLVVKDRQRIVTSLPMHCKGPVSALLDGYAEMWSVFADELR